MPSMPHSVRGPSRAAHLRRANHKGTFLFGQIRGHSYFALTAACEGSAVRLAVGATMIAMLLPLGRRGRIGRSGCILAELWARCRFCYNATAAPSRQR